MSVLTLELPLELSVEEARLLLAIKLYETAKLTLGQAAEISGYSQKAFMEVLGKYRVPVINYPPDDLEKEIHL